MRLNELIFQLFSFIHVTIYTNLKTIKHTISSTLPHLQKYELHKEMHVPFISCRDICSAMQ